MANQTAVLSDVTAGTMQATRVAAPAFTTSNDQQMDSIFVTYSGAKHGEINLTFNYPLGWGLDGDLSCGLLAARDLHHFAGGPLVSGQCGVLVMPLPDDLIADLELGAQYQVMTIANALFTEMFLSNRPYERISQVKPLDIGARSAASLSTSAADGDNLFILLEQKGGYVLFIGMTAYNELEASRALFLHIAGTVRCTPRR